MTSLREYLWEMFPVLHRVLVALAGAVALSGAALAAEPLPAPPPPPLFGWTGIYIGINAGGHWGGSSFDFTSTDTGNLITGGGLGVAQFFGVIPTSGTHGASGFIGGGQAGYNYQISSFVLGIEADVDGTTGRSTEIVVLNNVPSGFSTSETTTTSQRLDWLGTLRGRIGWTPIDRLLIYGTGGLAFGQSTSSFSVINPLATPPKFLFGFGNRHIGWTAGGGVEFALPDAWSNWSLKIEYLYYDLGTSAATVFYANPTTFMGPIDEFSSLTGRIRHNGNIARAGLNYKF